MSEDINVKTDADESPPVDLPPVEPPSAGFIIQLFVVPGLIVLAVVGVWALFGQLASSEQDWTKLVAELSNSNEHRRWRGAYGLAQMLQTAPEGDTDTPKLTQNPVIVDGLTELFVKELAKSSPSDDDIQFQAYLARTLGRLESPDKVFPVLREGMQSTHDREVRKNSVAAIAVIAGRARDRKQPLKNAALATDLIDVSSDADPLMRQVAAYTLGLIASERGSQRLIVLLDDPDENTKLNAAIALSRDGSTAGLSVFESVLSSSTVPLASTTPIKSNTAETNPATKQREINDLQYQRDVRLLNTLQALEQIAAQLSASEVKRIEALLKKVSDSKQIGKHFRQHADIVRKRLTRAG
ncbi:MAG: HEAT repeat domain-containing protein [Planctomycetaceae bacterium]|jgi:hypothetical protein|nr:HEAT repeat domain-containing protein [Planctomycetaceae bacterium]MBT6154991.1 HEAT repeat domain-containing protein [Planctomycetaceae bacterium]MBT6487334.1 HEAT repeat domain-containing protein [Planctomycetaceae bacterium]MBT6493048.1 HEAT repeat domain-containing protein [Planctomycetaceae bacterium]